MLIYTHCWELMNSVGSHGSSSLPFVMKVMVCHFVSDSHEVMTALIVVLPLIVVVEISLQLHGSVSWPYVCKLFLGFFYHITSLDSVIVSLHLDFVVKRIPQILLQPCYLGLDLLLYKLV
jgi:hypothetical protein